MDFIQLLASERVEFRFYTSYAVGVVFTAWGIYWGLLITIPWVDCLIHYSLLCTWYTDRFSFSIYLARGFICLAGGVLNLWLQYIADNCHTLADQRFFSRLSVFISQIVCFLCCLAPIIPLGTLVDLWITVFMVFIFSLTTREDPVLSFFKYHIFLHICSIFGATLMKMAFPFAVTPSSGIPFVTLETFAATELQDQLPESHNIFYRSSLTSDILFILISGCATGLISWMMFKLTAFSLTDREKIKSDAQQIVDAAPVGICMFEYHYIKDKALKPLQLMMGEQHFNRRAIEHHMRKKTAFQSLRADNSGAFGSLHKNKALFEKKKYLTTRQAAGGIDLKVKASSAADPNILNFRSRMIGEALPLVEAAATEEKTLSMRSEGKVTASMLGLSSSYTSNHNKKGNTTKNIPQVNSTKNNTNKSGLKNKSIKSQTNRHFTPNSIVVNLEEGSNTPTVRQSPEFPEQKILSNSKTSFVRRIFKSFSRSQSDHLSSSTALHDVNKTQQVNNGNNSNHTATASKMLSSPTKRQVKPSPIISQPQALPPPPLAHNSLAIQHSISQTNNRTLLALPSLIGGGAGSSVDGKERNSINGSDGGASKLGEDGADQASLQEVNNNSHEEGKRNFVTEFFKMSSRKDGKHAKNEEKQIQRSTRKKKNIQTKKNKKDKDKNRNERTRNSKTPLNSPNSKSRNSNFSYFSSSFNSDSDSSSTSSSSSSSSDYSYTSSATLWSTDSEDDPSVVVPHPARAHLTSSYHHAGGGHQIDGFLTGEEAVEIIKSTSRFDDELNPGIESNKNNSHAKLDKQTRRHRMFIRLPCSGVSGLPRGACWLRGRYLFGNSMSHKIFESLEHRRRTLLKEEIEKERLHLMAQLNNNNGWQNPSKNSKLGGRHLNHTKEVYEGGGGLTNGASTPAALGVTTTNVSNDVNFRNSSHMNKTNYDNKSMNGFHNGNPTMGQQNTQHSSNNNTSVLGTSTQPMNENHEGDSKQLFKYAVDQAHQKLLETAPYDWMRPLMVRRDLYCLSPFGFETEVPFRTAFLQAREYAYRLLKKRRRNSKNKTGLLNRANDTHYQDGENHDFIMPSAAYNYYDQSNNNNPNKSGIQNIWQLWSSDPSNKQQQSKLHNQSPTTRHNNNIPQTSEEKQLRDFLLAYQESETGTAVTVELCLTGRTVLDGRDLSVTMQWIPSRSRSQFKVSNALATFFVRPEDTIETGALLIYVRDVTRLRLAWEGRDAYLRTIVRDLNDTTQGMIMSLSQAMEQEAPLQQVVSSFTHKTKDMSSMLSQTKDDLFGSIEVAITAARIQAMYLQDAKDLFTDDLWSWGTSYRIPVSNAAIFTMAQAVLTAVRPVAPLCETRQNGLSLDMDDSMATASFFGDSARISQTLFNLLSLSNSMTRKESINVIAYFHSNNNNNNNNNMSTKHSEHNVTINNNINKYHHHYYNNNNPNNGTVLNHNSTAGQTTKNNHPHTYNNNMKGDNYNHQHASNINSVSTMMLNQHQQPLNFNFTGVHISDANGGGDKLHLVKSLVQTSDIQSHANNNNGMSQTMNSSNHSTSHNVNKDIHQLNNIGASNQNSASVTSKSAFPLHANSNANISMAPLTPLSLNNTVNNNQMGINNNNNNFSPMNIAQSSTNNNTNHPDWITCSIVISFMASTKSIPSSQHEILNYWDHHLSKLAHEGRVPSREEAMTILRQVQPPFNHLVLCQLWAFKLSGCLKILTGEGIPLLLPTAHSRENPEAATVFRLDIPLRPCSKVISANMLPVANALMSRLPPHITINSLSNNTTNNKLNSGNNGNMNLNNNISGSVLNRTPMSINSNSINNNMIGGLHDLLSAVIVSPSTNQNNNALANFASHHIPSGQHQHAVLHPTNSSPGNQIFDWTSTIKAGKNISNSHPLTSNAIPPFTPPLNIPHSQSNLIDQPIDINNNFDSNSNNILPPSEDHPYNHLQQYHNLLAIPTAPNTPYQSQFPNNNTQQTRHQNSLVQQLISGVGAIFPVPSSPLNSKPFTLQNPVSNIKNKKNNGSMNQGNQNSSYTVQLSSIPAPSSVMTSNNGVASNHYSSNNHFFNPNTTIQHNLQFNSSNNSTIPAIKGPPQNMSTNFNSNLNKNRNPVTSISPNSASGGISNSKPLSVNSAFPVGVTQGKAIQNNGNSNILNTNNVNLGGPNTSNNNNNNSTNLNVVGGHGRSPSINSNSPYDQVTNNNNNVNITSLSSFIPYATAPSPRHDLHLELLSSPPEFSSSNMVVESQPGVIRSHSSILNSPLMTTANAVGVGVSSAHRQVMPAQHTNTMTAASGMSALRLLLVEDNHFNANAVCLILERRFAISKVCCCATGEEAVKLITGEQLPSLSFLRTLAVSENWPSDLIASLQSTSLLELEDLNSASINGRWDFETISNIRERVVFQLCSRPYNGGFLPFFDVVLMDLHMPGDLSGTKATKRVRDHERKLQDTIPTFIAAVTGDSSLDARAECMAAGMDYFEMKPVNPHKLEMLLLKAFDTLATRSINRDATRSNGNLTDEDD